MIFRFFLAFYSIVILGSVSVAQDCTLHLTGRVLDRATKEPLEFTAVALRENNRQVLADSAGYFELKGLCPGAYHLQIYHVGCQPGQYYFTLQKDTSLLLYLDHHPQLLREIRVEGEQGSFERAGVRHSISASVLRENAHESLAEIAARVAGVRMLRNGAGISKPVIHGLYGNRVAIINNGMIQAGQQWGADHAPEIDLNAADRVTVVKSSDALAYGAQAIGGALVIEADAIPRDPHLHGSVGYGYQVNGHGHSLTTRLNNSNGKFSWQTTGAYKRSGDRRAPDYFLTNTGAQEAAASVQLQYQASGKVYHRLLYSLYTARLGIFAGSHISNLTDLEEAIGRDIPFRIHDVFSYAIGAPQQRVEHHLLKYAGKKFMEDRISVEWMYGIQLNHRREFDIRRGNRSAIPALDLSLWSHTLDVKFIHDKKRLTWKAGAQARLTDNTNDYDTGILPLIPDYFKGSTGVYGLGQYPLGKFIIEGGARYDLHMLRSWAITPYLPREIIKRDRLFSDLALSAGVVYSPGHTYETQWQLVVAARSPEPNELYSNGLHQGVAGIEEGDWNLTQETSFKTIWAQTLRLESLLHMELHLYSHLIRNYIYLSPQDELRLTIRGAFPVYRYVQEDAWLRGLDLVLVSDFSHRLEWSLRFSALRGKALDKGRALNLMPPAYGAMAVSWAFRDNVIFTGSKINVAGIYSARQKHWDAESDFLAPPESYFLLNFGFTTGIRLKRDMLHTGFMVENLLNAKYRDYLNRLRYFADEQGISTQIFVRYVF